MNEYIISKSVRISQRAELVIALRNEGYSAYEETSSLFTNAPLWVVRDLIRTDFGVQFAK